jgi:hypothetical protein
MGGGKAIFVLKELRRGGAAAGGRTWDGAEGDSQAVARHGVRYLPPPDGTVSLRRSDPRGHGRGPGSAIYPVARRVLPASLQPPSPWTLSHLSFSP